MYYREPFCCPVCGGTGYTKPLINLKEEEK